MIKEAGTVMLALLLDNVTMAPLGAAVVSVTVQVEVPGALTVLGEQLSEAPAEAVRLTVVV